LIVLADGADCYLINIGLIMLIVTLLLAARRSGARSQPE